VYLANSFSGIFSISGDLSLGGGGEIADHPDIEASAACFWYC